MAKPIDPCMSESRKHTWEWIRNFDRKKVSMAGGRITSVEVSCKGLYRCINCATRKEGRTQYEPAKDTQ